MEPSIPLPAETPAAPASRFDPIRSFARLGLGAAQIAAEKVLTTALNVIGVPEALRFARGRLSPIRGMTQERFDELVRVGRMEERHSRLLAEIALEDVSDSSIGELASRVSSSEEVRQVIRT